MAQDLRKIIERLNDLIALDHDALGGYEAAIPHIENDEVRRKMAEFRADHERHIRELSALVRQMGGTPRQRPDIKGRMARAFTAATSMLGTTAALHAMQGNTVLANRAYRSALEEEWTVEMRAVIERNFADVRRHLEYVEEALTTRPWEEAPAEHP
ncbi:MAG: PA2169 family four-helix-bundle protein [Myxococcaceae bacterium]|nr:PA2169 family four-helix-bundle protein [Myxococcaceae bacterium]